MEELEPTSKSIRIQTPRTAEGEHSTPLFLTSSFCFENAEDMRAAFAGETDANIYSRFVNPNVDEFIQKMCALEGYPAGFAMASGMAAISNTFFSLLKQGDHLLSCRSIFGSTHTVLSKYLGNFGIEYTYVDSEDFNRLTDFIKPNTKMVYLETPTNPGLEIIDLAHVASVCKERNILSVVDNCFATPYGQRPSEFGIDVVIHSATKWLDGQGRVLGGVVLGPENLINDIYLFCRSTGPSLSPFNAWVLSKSLETLEVRMERHCSNALYLAKSLENHPAITRVIYPFLESHPSYSLAVKQMKSGGGIVSFELKGGLEAGKKFLDALKMLSLTANLGDTRSIASHPASTTHAKLTPEERLATSITDGLIRISVGLENRDDILKDILQALTS